jgi:DNA-binding response OmpR family regulator
MNHFRNADFGIGNGNFEVFPLVDFDSDFLSLIDQYRPHVVMVYYPLHGERRLTACRHIKEKYSHLPVIASSCNKPNVGQK